MIMFLATGSHGRLSGPSAPMPNPFGVYRHIEGVDKGDQPNLWSLGFLR